MTIPDLQAIANGIDNGADSAGGGGRRVRVEPNHRRIRVIVGGVVIADTIRSLYLFETGHLPVYYFPRDDVRFDLLEPTQRTTSCPYKGEAGYWSIVVGDRTVENAVWGYPDPIDGAPDISDYVAFYWNKVDAWFEEDEQVYVHARDPYKRVDALRSSRHVQVSIHGEIVADTVRPVLLFETGLPTRYYVPKLDVRQDLLQTSPKSTACPYKGIASYVSVVVAGHEPVDDVGWFYPYPVPQVPTIENHIAFFDERVDVIVDGVMQARPTTPWS